MKKYREESTNRTAFIRSLERRPLQLTDNKTIGLEVLSTSYFSNWSVSLQNAGTRTLVPSGKPLVHADHTKSHVLGKPK